MSSHSSDEALSVIETSTESVTTASTAGTSVASDELPNLPPFNINDLTMNLNNLVIGPVGNPAPGGIIDMAQAALVQGWGGPPPPQAGSDISSTSFRIFFGPASSPRPTSEQQGSQPVNQPPSQGIANAIDDLPFPANPTPADAQLVEPAPEYTPDPQLAQCLDDLIEVNPGFLQPWGNDIDGTTRAQGLHRISVVHGLSHHEGWIEMDCRFKVAEDTVIRVTVRVFERCWSAAEGYSHRTVEEVREAILRGYALRESVQIATVGLTHPDLSHIGIGELL